MSEKFTGGHASARRKLNQLRSEVDALLKSLTTGRVLTTHTAGGSVSDLSMHQTRPRIAKQRRSSGIGINRRARTTEAATANDHITCNIYDSKGIEATSGDEFNVEVYGLLVDAGTALNTSIGKLRDNEDIVATKLPYDNSGTVEYRWYCTGLFQPYEECS